MEFRTDINGLRALAVLAVLFYHFGLPGFGGGFAGVDVFFVLSGYLMTGLLVSRLDQGAGVLWPFYLARARRILPALVVVSAAVLALGWVWVSPRLYAQLAEHALASVTFVSNILYWQQVDYFNPDARDFWLLHTWSLSVEWQFYLLYPLLLLGVARFCGEGAARRRRLAQVLGAVIALSFGLALLTAWRAPQAAFYLLPPRAWELLGGGLVWLVQERWRAAAGTRRLLALAGLAGVLLSIVLLDHRSAWATVWVGLPVLATMLVLLADAPGPVLGHPAAQALGRWSYSIYLWHWPVAVFLREWRPGAGPGWILAALVLSVLLGFASFRLVENPVRRGLGRLPALPQTLGHVVTAGLVALAALAVVEAAGVRSRLPLANAADYQRMSAERLDWRFPAACRMDGQAGHQARLCGAGPQQAPRLLVIGDSHAQQWYGWLAEALPQQGLRVDFFTWEGCSLGAEPRPDRDCAGFWRDAAAEAARIDARAVIVSSNWEVPVTGEPAADGAPPPDFRAQRRARERLPAVLAATREGGRPVLLVGALPTIGRSTPDDITSRLFRGSPVAELASGDCAAFRWRASGLTRDLRQLAQQAGASFVDPADAVCEEARTPVVSPDGHLLYRDGNHVSTAGAQRWAPAIFTPFLTAHWPEPHRPRMAGSAGSSGR